MSTTARAQIGGMKAHAAHSKGFWLCQSLSATSPTTATQITALAIHSRRKQSAQRRASHRSSSALTSSGAAEDELDAALVVLGVRLADMSLPACSMIE